MPVTFAATKPMPIGGNMRGDYSGRIGIVGALIVSVAAKCLSCPGSDNSLKDGHVAGSVLATSWPWGGGFFANA
jgi:hypothetical protein